jgi:6-phosphofructokinase 1
MIKAEAKGRFESRAAVPGHFQQGGKPSPMDRIRALRMALKCMQHVETYADMSPDEIAADDMSTVVFGIQGSDVVFTALAGKDGLEETDTNWEQRRPKNEFWRKWAGLVDTLSGRPAEGQVTVKMSEDEGWGTYTPGDFGD